MTLQVKKHKNESGFCPYCYRFVIITTNGKCFKCGAKLLVKTRHTPTLHKLDRFIEQNNDFVISDVVIPFEINTKTYYIPMSLIRDYMKIQASDDQTKVLFIDEIKRTCKSFKNL